MKRAPVAMVLAFALCAGACGTASAPPPDDDVTEEWTAGDDEALDSEAGEGE